MKLTVYSLKKTLFEGEAKSVNCKTASGEITVLDHHRPLVTALVSGVMKIVPTSGEDQYFPIASGFLEVNASNQVKVLADES